MFFLQHFSTMDFEEAASLLIAALTATCSPGKALKWLRKENPEERSLSGSDLRLI